MRTLPKPPRVEKWQRWRNEMGEVLVLAIEPSSIVGLGDFARLANGYGIRPTQELLTWPEWHFLGYAKPDKVEVGQRWRSKTCGYDVRRKMAHPRRDDVWELLGEDRVAMDSTETEIRGWEYLGMAESEGAKKEAPRPYAGLQSVIAAKTEYVTVDDLSEPPVQTKRTADQARQEARHANEEAAKRLIANPPAWAYTKAWTCAVLALQERANVDDHRIFPAFGDNICAEMLLEECKRAHNRQPRISGVVYDPIRDVLFDAYARGMERTSPLMGRSGVKGGVSTCDLGVDYE